MEDFLLVVLIIGFIIVLIRQNQLSARLRHLDELYQRLLRSQPQSPIQQQAPTAPITSAPATASAAHVPHPAAPAATPPPAAQQAAPPAIAAYSYKPAYVPAPPPPVAAKPGPAAFPPPPPPRREPKPHVSLEARLGQNWLNKLGITSIVVGIALYLGFELRHIGPLGKSLFGLVIALAILGLGIFLERKPNYRIFARACIGGGWALLFFLSFAIYHLPLLQILHSSLADLVMMLIVAAGMVAHSLRYHSQTITTLAFFLALLTVGISDVTIFSLVAGALLAGALAIIVYRERWYLLGLFGTIGVYLNHAIWLHRVLPDGGIHGYTFPEFLPSAALLLAYWLTFRIVYVFRAPLAGPDQREQQGISGFAAILNSIGLLTLLKYQSSHPEWAFAALLVLGFAELSLAFIARGTIRLDDTEAPRNRPAFIILSTIASVVLLAAIPFRFRGASWSLLWLLEAEAFFLAGIRLPEIIFRRLGIIANGVTATLLVFSSVALIAANSLFGMGATTSHHPIPVLVTAALVLWLNAELATRLAPSIIEPEFDRFALRASSYLAALLAALALTIALHPGSAWLGIAWLVLGLLLTDNRLKSQQLATQADLLAAAAVLHTIAINLQLDPHTPYSLFGLKVSLQLVSVMAIALFLYVAARRNFASHILFAEFVAPVYTWAAAALITALCWFQFSHIALAVAWGVFALILFELGLRFRLSYLRQQGYALLALSFIRIFFANLNWYDGYLPRANGTISPALYTVIPLIIAFAYVYERTRSSSASSQFDKLAGTLAAWFGLVAAGSLLYTELRADWVILGWTFLSITTLAIAATLKRRIFVAQSYVTLGAVLLRGVFVLFITSPAGGFYNSRPFTIGLSSALLLLVLPVAFYLHRHHATTPSAEDAAPRPDAAGRSEETRGIAPTSGLTSFLHHPEQPFFFTPLLLLTLLIYVELHGGLITIGWVALGLAAFLFALTVKERPFRLSGLGLLLLGVAKILLWDVWHAPLAERYLTLIIMGAALLLVSFLYSRYRETLLKFL